MKTLLEKIIRLGRIVRVTVIRKTIHLSRRVIIPGFEGISLWEVIFFFIWSIKRGLITTRAAALSFHFFLAMIPFGLILVVLSANLPFFDIESDIAPVLANFIPDQLFYNFLDNLENYKNSSVTSFISFGFLVAIYFTSNGFSMLLSAFNSSRHKFKKRKWWSIKLISILFVIGFIVSILGLFLIILFMRKLITVIGESSAFVHDHFDGIFTASSFILVTILMYFGVTLLYYFGPREHKKFKLFSAGATLATLMIILISFLYSYYVSNFGRYNDLYGSLGTIMMLLLWIYLNSFALLIGFELNASIHGAILNKRLDNLERIENRYDKNY